MNVPFKTHIKVYGGTPQHGEKSRCLTCRQAQVIKGVGQGDEQIYCHTFYPERLIKQPVIECSAYDDKRHPALHELKSIAWRLNTEKDGRVIGFISPKEWKKLHSKHGVDDEDD